MHILSVRGLFIRHHLQQHFLGSKRYYFRTPVWKLLATVTFLGPLIPPIVLFRPSIVSFVSSDIYGAATCASTPPHCRSALSIAKRSSLLFAMMEEAMMEEASIADATGANKFTLYIPDFLQEYSLSNKSLEEQKNELLRKDWLTSGLTYEI
jgi:hypothetical protein